MGVYRDRIYPALVTRLGDPEPIRNIRRRLLPLASGSVLEIGVGPGVNFPHYDRSKVTKLYALEPNPGMIRLAERQRRRSELEVEFLDLPGEEIPLPDDSIDTVVSTFTLCTIAGVAQAIRGVARVLKPDGKLIFFEIGAASDARVRRWQHRWEPIHHRLFAGLYLTRDIPSLLEQGGFVMERVETGYVAQFPKSWSHCFRGTATLGVR
jgi:ubiquinone/menaquinone biosynthesis C-methylase UbiE